MDFLHDHINKAFNETLSFLLKYAPNYKDLIAQGKQREILLGEEAMHLAAQFHEHMLRHTRKVQDILEKITADSEDTTDNIIVVDIGCGGGAACVGIIANILQKDHKPTNKPFHIYLIGADPNTHALIIYNKMIQNLANRTKREIHIEHHIVAKGMPEALPYIAEYLSSLRIRLGKPHLPNLFIMQVNVIRPLNTRHQEYVNNSIKPLLKNGVLPETTGNKTFGEIEAQSYEQLLNLSKTDHALFITIGTEHEKIEFDQQQNVLQMGQALHSTIKAQNHEVIELQSAIDPCPIRYKPNGKIYRYYANVLNVIHKDHVNDADWERIISIDNLKLAWARVRASQTRESLVDEFEIRIFENALEEKLSEIQKTLSNYDLLSEGYKNLDQRYPQFHYQFPKTDDKARPRTILRLEEEIISAAVVQVLGQRASALMTNVYAYRLSNQHSEHFYRSWFRGYKHFVRDVIKYASKLNREKIVILQVDIKNFYPSIEQSRLYNLAGDELRALRSDRIMWLLEKLLIREMRSGTNGKGLGIPQGGTISGFLANLYLTKIHERFNDTYEEARLFRYVDDMIIVIHDRANEQHVIDDLDKTCKELGLTIPLSVNEGKFYRWEDVSQFEEDVELSKEINRLNWKFQHKMAHLYLMNDEYRQICNGVDNWWEFVSVYGTYLSSIGIYIKSDRLSRKLHQYIQNPHLRVKAPDGWASVAHLNFLAIQGNYPSTLRWQKHFKANNINWVDHVQELKEKISKLLVKHWEQYIELLNNGHQIHIQTYQIRQKKLLAVIRFCVGRLARVGYDLVQETIVKIFCCNPEIIRDPRSVFEHLAMQGEMEILMRILQCLEESRMPGIDYLRASILQALRYLPDAEQDNLVQQTLKRYAIASNSTNVERLMALQAIASLSLCDSQLALQLHDLIHHITEPRLLTAIILILGDKHPAILRKIPQEILSDSFVRFAFDKAKQQQIDSLWKPTEVKDLRFFYASAYPDGADEFEDGSSP